MGKLVANGLDYISKPGKSFPHCRQPAQERIRNQAVRLGPVR
jgi:hypothetical protein